MAKMSHTKIPSIFFFFAYASQIMGFHRVLRLMAFDELMIEYGELNICESTTKIKKEQKKRPKFYVYVCHTSLSMSHWPPMLNRVHLHSDFIGNDRTCMFNAYVMKPVSLLFTLDFRLSVSISSLSLSLSPLLHRTKWTRLISYTHEQLCSMKCVWMCRIVCI